ncbi:MAG TPA: PIG-L family deacetylase [Thermoanaerobaculia bacterium]|nr:PIG-L family deacetylase [Thermoanaerobaculia bacterium]
MTDARRLMVVAAHPDDETLGFGGVLARYAAEGVATFLLTATRGDRGRYFGHPAGHPEHPGRRAMALIREKELSAAAAVLGLREVRLLDYEDQELDRADVAEVMTAIVGHLRRARPDVVLTFAPDGSYGHPDHIAISQLTTAAVVASADPGFGGARAPTLGQAHAVKKLYYLAWGESAWDAYQSAFKKLVSTVDGVERQANPWPDWALTTVVDTRSFWPVVSRAVSCHESQVGAYAALKTLAPAQHEALWGSQSFYRAFSLVNGGRRRESDLFEGVERAGGQAGRA